MSRRLVWQVPFGATRPDGVTANRAPFDLQPATVPEVLAWLDEQHGVDVVTELREARDAILGWAGHASDYFKDKWDLDGDLARIDAALAALYEDAS